MAQLVERLVRNEEASGSNPLISTKKPFTLKGFFFCSPNVPQNKKLSRPTFLYAVPIKTEEIFRNDNFIGQIQKKEKTPH